MGFISRLAGRRKKEIFGILFLALTFLVGISLFTYDHTSDLKIIQEKEAKTFQDHLSQKFKNQAGLVGAYVSYGLLYALGFSAFVIPVFLLLFGTNLLFGLSTKDASRKLMYIFFLVLLFGAVLDINPITKTQHYTFADLDFGGWAAFNLTKIIWGLFGTAGTYIIGIAALFALVVTISPFRLGQWVSGIGFVLKEIGKYLSSVIRKGKKEAKKHRAKKELKRKRKEKVEEEYQPEYYQVEEESVNGDKKTLELKRKEYKTEDFEFPSLNLLEDPPRVKSSVSNEELNQTASALIDTLSTFEVEIEGDKIEKFPGPVITRYEFKPAPGVKVNQIMGLSDDLALALQAKRIRIIAPVPGKAAVGVEIPNRSPQIVYLKDILDSEGFQKTSSRLSLALGKTISGETFVTDLSLMPHLLIAGSTGSGKSVCLNSIITSLLFRLHPDQVRFVMIDPKMLELTCYDGIPHLEKRVVTNAKLAEKILSEIVVEMEVRYRKLAEAGTRNIEDYNRKSEKILPYLIIVVDELADLMMAGSTRIEALITRLAQMARAVGIHLILATQRPSVDVITGLIKANFSARIAFQVASKVDSRTILDINGAEKLLGRGDMLFIRPGHPEPERVHGAYVSREDTERMVDFLKSQNYSPEPLDIFKNEEERQQEIYLRNKGKDDLFLQAAELVIRHKQGSVSLLQRRLEIGYQRAARLIDQLEEEGVVGPYDGSKAREVLADTSYLEKKGFFKRKDYDER
ncbi:MAG: hypothetical protein AMJ90_04615 [candidate division Zixibacteria bacterium SM23_73_2]|nr:MAG: hypothetical protein AMJ90_04615 [candidate division Zixibacteria bacterium SM23_73_2]